MGQDFENHLEAAVPATPEQVWDAVATGPGISSWFIGRTEVDGDTVRTSFGDDWIPAGTVTAAEAPHRFSYRSDTAPDGRFVAYEYLIEGRAGAATVLRAVTSGFLPGEDWAEEYEAMGHGTALFFHTLTEHLRHFPGRPATPLTVFGPPVTDWGRTWRRLHRALGLPADPQPGAATDSGPAGGGVVTFVNPHALAVRTADAQYRFLRGRHGGLIAAHELHGPAADPAPWAGLLTSLER